MAKYHVYNSRTGRQTTVIAKSENDARTKGRKKIGTKTGIVRAYKLKK